MSPGTWEHGPSHGSEGLRWRGFALSPNTCRGPVERVGAGASMWDWPLLLHPVRGSAHSDHEEGESASVTGRTVVLSDVHALIPRTTEYVGFRGKGDFADMIKRGILRWEMVLELLGGGQCHLQVLVQGRQEGQREQSCDNRIRGQSDVIADGEREEATRVPLGTGKGQEQILP